ncbi:hypothetical protein LPJ78_001865 [Coemansia sp. RSA 989]|nr:Skp1 family, dimerization domain-containing protein [Coemansia mojavensis]KAJ1742322.1 hypothetical protein LPJ68_002031 [Coemansia sp. RSA 1086]KAJ1751690.1 hypothetical protein LPJ79_001854 [Coemansia sp. RSA 1821]KAJ1866400.1 hypothetical protein LPJ78_001865 [Coemansia sp. RSA 989]KAJ2653223.1 hypothetical protein IWW40_000589 [Coemansia sp. RSA 1250]KAJ2674485.1 hypothetical protein IWW42_001655 [Coemansia sp. RSA 1085]
MIRLESFDGRLFAVDYATASMSSIISSVIEDIGVSSTPIALPNVSGAILAKVIEYCIHHKDDAVPSKRVEWIGDSRISAWDRQFVDIDDTTMLQLLYAADYLGVESLVDLICQRIAQIIRDMPVEAIRQRYGVVNDFDGWERQKIEAETQAFK